MPEDHNTYASPPPNLITGKSNNFILCRKQIPDIVTDLQCHDSPCLPFPSKQVMSFYLFAPMDHVNSVLVHCWSDSLFSLLVSPRELNVTLTNTIFF